MLRAGWGLHSVSCHLRLITFLSDRVWAPWLLHFPPLSTASLMKGFTFILIKNLITKSFWKRSSYDGPFLSPGHFLTWDEIHEIRSTWNRWWAHVHRNCNSFVTIILWNVKQSWSYYAVCQSLKSDFFSMPYEPKQDICQHFCNWMSWILNFLLETT